MPLLIPTSELRAGVQLYEPIVSRGRVMLQRGRALTEADAEVIRRRYPGMRVRVVDPVLDEAVEFEDDSKDRQIATEAQASVSECVTRLRERFAERAQFERVDFDALRANVAEVAAYLRSCPVTAALVQSCMDGRNYLSAHAGNVFYLSLVLGSAAMDYIMSERRRQTRARNLRSRSAMDLTPLGLGAAVMDLGMIPLEPLICLERPLTIEESERVRGHPQAGVDLLPAHFSAVARMVVRTHHENCAGKGYPRGLSGDRLHVFTRIVRIADAFDAGTSDRLHRAAKSGARVLWEMWAGPHRGLYDARLMQAFAGLIQPFPIGARIQLKDERHAVVVKYNRRNPFDPVVIIAFDAEKRPLPRERLEGPFTLSSQRGLRLGRYDGEDLSYLDDVAPPQPAETRRRFASLLEAVYP